MVLACLAPLALLAQIPDKTDRFVNDFAGVLGVSNVAELEHRLQMFSDTTTNQIVVVTVSDLQGYDPADYAQRLGQQWGVGHEKYDNGVIILLKPRNDNGRGRVFIATGYGVEGVLTDVRAGNIIDTKMMPHLAEGDYYAAVVAAVDEIEPLLLGEYHESWETPADTQDNSGWLLVFFVLLMAFVWIGLKKPSAKTKALNAISEAESPEDRDSAVESAQQINISQTKIDRALAKIPGRLKAKMRESSSRLRFETLASAAAMMGVSADEIAALRTQMASITLNNLKGCRSRFSLSKLAETAREFGNSEHDIEMAVLAALAAIAIAERMVRSSYRGSRFNGGSSGGTWHSGFGGGSFGGGGAGRSF